MKKLSLLKLLGLYVVILINSSCGKEDNPPSASSIKWKRFKVETVVFCGTGNEISNYPVKWINFWTYDEGGEQPSNFIPKPNTWYRGSNNYSYKTGTDVAPYEGGNEPSMNVDNTTDYTQACP